MSDKPEKVTAVAPEASTEDSTANDRTLQLRRILAWGIAAVVGLVLTAGGHYLFPALFGKPPVPLNDVLLISFVNIPLIVLTFLPMWLFTLIWVDYFMGTKILPD